MTVRTIDRLRTLLMALALLAAISVPAFAHEEHRKQQEAAQAAAQKRQAQAAKAGGADAQAMHENMGEMMMNEKDRSQLNFFERLLDWFGRTHPVIVHFPIAFFPAALFTAIVGRRRPAFAAPVQFLVVAGGIVAPVAAIFGWFNGGFGMSDSDPLMMFHRWLGTAIGIGGLLMAIWAWRRPWEDRGAGMIVALSVMSIAIVVQGWFGGALVHGIEHMNW